MDDKRLSWQSYQISLMILLSVFIYMLFINFYMPVMFDDFRYSFNWDLTKRIESWQEIFEFQIQHYLEWGGRTIAHTIAQGALLLGKPLFNIVNSFLFVMMLVLIYWHATGKAAWKIDPFKMTAIIFFIWFCLPRFGETMLWIVGAANYLWMAVLTLLFLLPYRLSIADKTLLSMSAWKSWLLSTMVFVLGVLSGWNIENSALMALAAAIIFTIYHWRNKAMRFWMLAGLCGVAIGCAASILAPGNYVRAALLLELQSEPYSFFRDNIIGGLKTILRLTFQALPIYIVLVIMGKRIFRSWEIAITQDVIQWKKQNLPVVLASVLYIGLSLLGLFVMFASPTFPLRAGMSPIVFLIIGTVQLFDLEICKVTFFNKRKKLTAVMLLLLIPTAFLVFGKYQTLFYENQQREAYIEACKANEIYDIQLVPFSVKDRSVIGRVIVVDIRTDPQFFLNQCYARYYGVSTVRLSED